MDYISGEKIQQLCDVYIGESYDFIYNPKIKVQTSKHKDIQTIKSEYNNPKLVFCYTHRIPQLFDKIHLFKNKFVLVSHNSDYIITEKDIQKLDDSKIIHWFSQNVNVLHNKLTCLPIGIANSQWPHGNIENFLKVTPISHDKKIGMYFYFNVGTCPTKRNDCKRILESKGFKFGSNIPHDKYILDLATNMKYAVSPEGNGVDCHRTWECLYANVIPICKRTINADLLSKIYPIITVDDWNEVDINLFDKTTYKFNNEYLSLDYYKSLIYSYIKTSE
jgi:hypothetical protein